MECDTFFMDLTWIIHPRILRGKERRDIKKFRKDLFEKRLMSESTQNTTHKLLEI